METADVLAAFRGIFGNVTRAVDARIFYDVYRPVLNGFFPEGIVLEGISDEVAKGSPFLEADGARVVSKGPSAGQSSVIMLIDMFLGVRHDMTGEEFQAEMLSYMPTLHRKMMTDYSEKCQRHHVASFVLKSNHGHLREAYDSCVKALHELRRFHLAMVSRYLSSTSTGTGASTWRSLLQAMSDSTGRARLCPISQLSQRHGTCCR